MQAVKLIADLVATGVQHGALAFVREDERIYQFHKHTFAPDDDDTVIQATDTPEGAPGRFMLILKASSAGGSEIVLPIDIADVSGLQTTLDGLQSQIDGLPTLPINESDVTNLVSDLASKAELPIAQADVTGLVSALAGKAATSHTHAEADVTGLVSDLAAKEATANKGAASGYASLNSSSKVVQDPANATATPTASKIVIADASGLVDGWVSANAAAGTPSLRKIGTGATDACAGNDSRLSDSRTPTAHETSHRSGGGDELSILNLAGYPADATKFLRGDGSFVVPDYASGADDPLGLGFFSANSLLPTQTCKLQLYAYPSTDFANLNSGTKSVSMSRARFTPGGTNAANWGWDLGGLKSRVLIIFGMIRARSNVHGLFMTGTLPSAGQFEDGFVFNSEPGVPDMAILKRASSAWTSLGSETKFTQADTFIGPSFGMAFYYDDATNRLIGFVRTCGEAWVPVVDVTSTSFTTMRYVGIHNDAGTATGANQIVWDGCPMAILYDN